MIFLILATCRTQKSTQLSNILTYKNYTLIKEINIFFLIYLRRTFFLKSPKTNEKIVHWIVATWWIMEALHTCTPSLKPGGASSITLTDSSCLTLSMSTYVWCLLRDTTTSLSKPALFARWFLPSSDPNNQSVSLSRPQTSL